MVNIEKRLARARSQSDKVSPGKSAIRIETCRASVVEGKGNINRVPCWNYFVPVILEDVVVFVQQEFTGSGVRNKGK
jgi:hypothetical protein